MGAGVAVYTYLRVKKIPILDHVDVVLFGAANGMFLGRLGCFSAHDHPGCLTSFVLGVHFPQGVRHDLGLYEALLWGVIALPIWITMYRSESFFKKTGRVFVWVMGSYSFGRFLLEFLRATDIAFSDRRFWGLTPAQYVMVFFASWSVWFFLRTRPPEK